ncbi:DUF2189 domain-containing protein [Sphingomonas lacunae]|uniref:DUF2189 domain-containing protein n=1 Tax=Sphingomonas lacunae TaxID=2698828 RepID=A0A6M4AWN3_9SPHN|nr:DUF2189 domain-containing protein [Sphingomonas lacunae]QJQ31391.1 DUF2189 domain-containing protein [Sphingomonas lacunae]
MGTNTTSGLPRLAIAQDLGWADIRMALARGWRDFAAHPLFGLFFGGIYVLGGLLLLYGLSNVGRGWWLIPIIAGFPLFAPFSAVGLYEVSRRRELGEPMHWRAVLGALKGRGDEQLVLMGGIIFVAFSFWMIIAHGIFAIFVGESGIGFDGSGLALSWDMIAMLLVGGAVGGLFALGLFAITVVSLPMLVDRDVDFISAMIASMSVFGSNKPVMIGWALFIATTLCLAMAPLFFGLFVILPVLGHATWHLYRRAVADLPG